MQVHMFNYKTFENNQTRFKDFVKVKINIYAFMVWESLVM